MFALAHAHKLRNAPDIDGYICTGASAVWNSVPGFGLAIGSAEAAAAWPSAQMVLHGVLSLPPSEALSEDAWRGIVGEIHRRFHVTNAGRLPWTAGTHQWTSCEHVHYGVMLPRLVDRSVVQEFRAAARAAEAATLPSMVMSTRNGTDRQRRHRRLQRYERRPYQLGEAEHGILAELGWDIRVLGERHEEVSVLPAGDADGMARAAQRGYRCELIAPGGDRIVGMPSAMGPAGVTPAWIAATDDVLHYWYLVRAREVPDVSVHDRRAATRLAVVSAMGDRSDLLHRQSLPLAGPGWRCHTRRLDRRGEIVVDLCRAVEQLRSRNRIEVNSIPPGRQSVRAR